ncbi:hypothetical protein H0O02_00050 [Candidatus Micrarchaeota archaeon]|nr:hypothetical protein [Candidatus Micrarchaeota archaeon]
MPKKRGLASKIWDTWVWIVSGFLHIFYVLAKSIIWAAGFIISKAVAAGKNAAPRGKPRSSATYQPLVLQKQLTGSLSEFEDKLLSSKSTIGLVLGARGSGKSALGMRILENVAAKNRKVCAMGFDESTLPGWIRFVRDVEEVPNGYFVLVDEGGIAFSSRSSQSPANRILSSLLLVARHKDVSVLFISQNSANLEINTIRQSDYLLMRKPSLLQKEFERKKIGEIYDEIKTQFADLADNGRYSTYIYSDEFRGFVTNELPGFWSQKASKSFAQVKLKQSKKMKTA